MFPAILAPIDAFPASGDDDPFVLRAGKNLMYVRVIQPIRNLRPVLAGIITDQNSTYLDGGEKPLWRFMVRGEEAHARSQFRAGRETAAGGAEADPFQLSPCAPVARAIERRRHGAREYSSGQREQSVRRQARHVGFGALPFCTAVITNKESGMFRGCVDMTWFVWID